MVGSGGSVSTVAELPLWFAFLFTALHFFVFGWWGQATASVIEMDWFCSWLIRIVSTFPYWRVRVHLLSLAGSCLVAAVISFVAALGGFRTGCQIRFGWGLECWYFPSLLQPVEVCTLEWIHSKESSCFPLLPSVPSRFVCFSRFQVWRLRVLKYLCSPKGEFLICSLSEVVGSVLTSLVASPVYFCSWDEG